MSKNGHIDEKDIPHVIRESLEQANKIAREYISSSLSTVFVEQFTAPPTIVRGGRDSYDISGLEVELFLDRSRIIIQRFH